MKSLFCTRHAVKEDMDRLPFGGYPIPSTEGGQRSGTHFSVPVVVDLGVLYLRFLLFMLSGACSCTIWMS
jgi:hypothetical protein